MDVATLAAKEVLHNTLKGSHKEITVAIIGESDRNRMTGLDQVRPIPTGKAFVEPRRRQ